MCSIYLICVIILIAESVVFNITYKKKMYKFISISYKHKNIYYKIIILMPYKLEHLST